MSQMTNWEYIQSLLDIIDRQNRIIEIQSQVLAMYNISIDRGENNGSNGDHQ